MSDVSVMLDIIAGADRYDNLTFDGLGTYPEAGYASQIVGRSALNGMKIGLLWNPYWSTAGVR